MSDFCPAKEDTIYAIATLKNKFFSHTKKKKVPPLATFIWVVPFKQATLTRFSLYCRIIVPDFQNMYSS